MCDQKATGLNSESPAASQQHDNANDILPASVLVAVVLLLGVSAVALLPLPTMGPASSLAELDEAALPVRALYDVLAASDGDELALTSEGRLEAFVLRTGAPRRRERLPQSGVLVADQSRDGQVMALGSFDGTLRIERDSLAESEFVTVRCGSAVESVVVSSAGDFVVADTRLGSPRLYDARTGRPRVVFARDVIDVIAISPDDALVAVIDSDTAQLQLLATADGGLVGHTLLSEPVRTACFSPCGTAIVVGTGEGSISCRSVPALTERWGVAASRDRVPYYPCSAIAVTGTTVAAEYGLERLRLFHLPTGEALGSCDGHRGGIANLFFSKDGQRLTCISRDGLVRVRDAKTLAELWRAQLSGVGSDGPGFGNE